ncbi:MAG: STN domain-containing protein, partial [Cyclobacteriaceae bacterium]
MGAVFRNVLIIFLFSGSVCAQQTILRKEVDFDAADERFEDVMLTLAQQNGFSFSYNPDLLPVDSLISLHVENSSLKSVLEVLMGEELELKQRGNHLVILRTRYTSVSGSPQRG